MIFADAGHSGLDEILSAICRAFVRHVDGVHARLIRQRAGAFPTGREEPCQSGSPSVLRERRPYAGQPCAYAQPCFRVRFARQSTCKRRMAWRQSEF